MAKKSSKKQQQFTLQPWMIAALVVVLVAVVGVIVLVAQNGDDDGGNNSYTTLSVQATYDRTSTDPNAVFVDIREPSEWVEYGLPEGALPLSMGNIMNVPSGAVEGLPQDQPIYVICNSGNRSVQVSNHLIDLGYKKVYNVDGGIQAWITAGLPRTPYTQ